MAQAQRSIQTETPAPRARTRTRSLNLQPVADDAVEVKTAQVKAQLARFWELNTAANAAAREAKKAKEVLNKLMGENNITEAMESVKIGDKVVPVRATISAGETSSIDVAKLKTLVDDETFMEIVKATKTDVTKHAGTNVVALTETVKAKAPALKVAEVK